MDARAWPLGSVGVMQRPAAFSALPGGTSQPGPVRPITLAVVAGAVLILVGAAYGPLARRKARKRA